MSALRPSPAGSPTPRAGPTLFSDTYCGSCRAREGCAAFGTVEACGDPAEYASPVHPVATPLPPLQSLLWPAFKSSSATLQLGQALILADRVRPPLGLGVRLRSSLVSLGRDERHACCVQPQGAVAALLGGDHGIDRVWRSLPRLGRALALEGFSAVIAPAYSTWGHDSPYAGRISVLQSAHAAAVLAEHLPTIPAVAWRYYEDLRQWTSWICGYSIGAIAIDCADADTPEEWNRAVEGIRFLASSIEDRSSALPRLIVNGPSTLARIAAVAQAWGGPLTIASQQPWQLGRSGKVLREDLSVEVAARWETADALLAENYERFHIAVDLVLDNTRHSRRRFA